MERWLVLLQKIRKLMPHVMAVLLVLAVAGLGIYQWQKPALDQLKLKDPYRYQLMVNEVQLLHWVDAWRQYVELQEISLARLYQERYQRWQMQWQTDGEFRQNVLRQKAEVHQQLKKSQKKKYDRQLQELEQFRKRPDAVLLKAHWEQATPWQKSLMLRDGCIRYLSRELEDYRQRRRVKGSLHGVALLAQSRISNASPGSLCREMVSLSHDEPSVHRALRKLRKEMNYYYFSRLLADIGISDSELFTVSGKLKGMTRDFNGF